ncbi:anti-sigma factor [Serinicoccus profundi]|uniref:anti-sigma factor n=1 Tax=Serinicoccus profundi TaxID=1078471 RepID=UPI000255E220|nr:anti-sigma factor [Serinicoccus profundi]
MNPDRYADRPAGDPPADRVEGLLRRAGDVSAGPPPGVWEAVRAELTEDEPAQGAVGTPRRDDLAGRRGADGGRRPARWPLLAAAAVGALVAWLGTQVLGAGPGASEVVVADGTLAELPDAGEPVEGTAQVVAVDGEQRLRVEVAELPDAGEGYLEVWLLRPDLSGMVTVGVISGTSAEFSLPAGVDLADYAVVDISREALDGDPAHGGQSVVRGELRDASAG